MNATMPFAKMLALMPVVALAAACGNSASPGASTSVPSSALATDSDDASATFAQPCVVTSVSLRTEDATSRSMIWVQAVYRPDRPGYVACGAPRWSADRKGLVVDSANPFRAGYPRSMTGIVNVTAMAPNGVQNTIRVDLGGGVALAASTNNQACRLIDDVKLRADASNPLRIRVQAVYSYTPATTSVCTLAPSWTSLASGLVVEGDGFNASIARRANQRLTVTATAPNGVARSLTF